MARFHELLSSNPDIRRRLELLAGREAARGVLTIEEARDALGLPPDHAEPAVPAGSGVPAHGTPRSRPAPAA